MHLLQSSIRAVISQSHLEFHSLDFFFVTPQLAVAVPRAGSAELEAEQAGAGAAAGPGPGGGGAAGRAGNPLDPLLMRLAHDWVDERDLGDRLAKLFLVRHLGR